MLHSITSSARASRVGGTSMPSAFAVLRLITNSYFVGACTGARDASMMSTRNERRPYAQLLSCCFSSLKKRQSVPCAMILLGLDLMMPASRRRKAQNRIVSSDSYSRHRKPISLTDCRTYSYLSAMPLSAIRRAAPCRKTCRPYVSAGTCPGMPYRARCRHRGPAPPDYRVLPPLETVRGAIYLQSTICDVPLDGPENRNEHGAEQSPATACHIEHIVGHHCREGQWCPQHLCAAWL